MFVKIGQVYTNRKSTISLINSQFTILKYQEEEQSTNKDRFSTMPVGRDKWGDRQTQTRK